MNYQKSTTNQSLMFRKQKEFPAGAFIPHPQRIAAITQLCLSFSLILWYAAQPFMGEYFALRSRMLLYEYVMGTSETVKVHLKQEEKLKRQALRFAKLPGEDKEMVLADYRALQSYSQRPVLTKIGDGLRVLFLKIPPFELAWIFFSIAIAILILLKVEGANQAAWLLPFITLAYVLDSHLNGHLPASSPDYSLFPSETFLIQNYVQEPLDKAPLKQKQQLQRGWEDYLVDKWLPSTKKEIASEEQGVEEAEFYFTLARLKRLHFQLRSAWLPTFHEKVSSSKLIAYCLWNVLFAWIMNRSRYASAFKSPHYIGLQA